MDPMEFYASLLRVLPFIVIIIFEVSPHTVASEFESTFDDFFDSTRYELIHNDARHMLLDEFSNQIPEEDIRRVFANIQQNIGLDEESTVKHTVHFVKYSNDVVKTRASLLGTSFSALVIFLDFLSAFLARSTSFFYLPISYQFMKLNHRGAFLIFTTIILTIYIPIILHVDSSIQSQFNEISPHKYSREEEDWKFLLPRFRILLNIFVIVVIIVISYWLP